MTVGDVEGPATELVLTCRTPTTGNVAVAEADAVALAGPCEVRAASGQGAPVFGQVWATTTLPGAAVPVRVRGLCVFTYTGPAPTVGGNVGIEMAAEPGKVQAAATGPGTGTIVSVDPTLTRVEVLL